MSIVTVNKNTYTVEPLYQWDKDQTLEIRGLSLAKVPEIHFAHEGMGRAIVRQSTMDAAGVVTVDVPNSLLQKPYTVHVYVCAYTGGTFETLYKIDVPVKARECPADYTLENDHEVYSFNALENEVANALHSMEQAVVSMKQTVAEAVTDCQNAADTSVKNLVGYSKAEILDDDTKAVYDGDTPDEVFNLIKTQMGELKDYALLKGCQAVGADGGLDGTELVTVTTEGQIGFPSATTTNEVKLTFSFEQFPDEARICRLDGFDYGVTPGYYNGAQMTCTAAAVVKINDTEVDFGVAEVSGQMYQSTGNNSYFSGPDFSTVAYNFAALFGRPLTNKDTVEITVTYTQTGTSVGYGPVKDFSVPVRYLEV